MKPLKEREKRILEYIVAEIKKRVTAHSPGNVQLSRDKIHIYCP